jgi:hypothetical protein
MDKGFQRAKQGKHKAWGFEPQGKCIPGAEPGLLMIKS